VTNEPGVLAQVAGMFAARGFNIDSLVVGRTENPEISRMTIVVIGDTSVLEQVRKQLQKLVPVVKVVDFQGVSHVERDLMLVQVATGIGDISDSDSARRRGEIVELANLFRAKVVDVGTDRLMIELSGTEEKIEAFIKLIHPYGIVELARTGVIAMPRGDSTADRLEAGAVRVRQESGGENSQSGSGPTVDPGDLPPG
jgi:acetolactate synthase I/III small subunit